jgi:hypothetical protein
MRDCLEKRIKRSGMSARLSKSLLMQANKFYKDTSLVYYYEEYSGRVTRSLSN